MNTLKFDIYSVWNRPPRQLTKNTGESKTVKHNYVPVRVQIERMYAAGQRLDGFQQGVYDYNADPETGYFNFSANMLDIKDPTRARHFDLTDYSELERDNRQRLYNQTIETLEQRRKALVSMGDTIIKDKVSPDKSGLDSAPKNSKNKAESGGGEE